MKKLLKVEEGLNQGQSIGQCPAQEDGQALD